MGLMRVVRRVSLGWLFVNAGVDVLRRPEGRVRVAAPALARLRAHVPGLPEDDTALVRANAGVQLIAGIMLMADRAPRLAAAVLAGSLIPTTVAGHPYWSIRDPVLRAQQRAHFSKNVAIFGGLLFATTSDKRARAPRPADGGG
jgi:putative oxidoreductase